MTAPSEKDGFSAQGPARLLGDDVNTDYIISSRRKRVTIDADALRAFLLEDYDKALGERIKPGDVMVAGRNFGCGSAMEVAVTVVRAAGVSCVLAKSFARAYYRNAINNGLMPVICDTDGIDDGDALEITVDASGLIVKNVTKAQEFKAGTLSPIMLHILKAGGLTPYLLERGDFTEPK